MSLPGFGIGMINDDFHIAVICQDVTERLKRIVMYSIVLGPRCFKCEMMILSGPNALLFLQLLIALITRSAVNVCHLLVSLLTNRASSCLDDENELPLQVIASFSALRFALPSIPLTVPHSMVRSVFWTMVSKKSQFKKYL